MKTAGDSGLRKSLEANDGEEDFRRIPMDKEDRAMDPYRKCFAKEAPGLKLVRGGP